MQFACESEAALRSVETDALADGIPAGPKLPGRSLAHNCRSVVEIGAVPNLLLREVAASHDGDADGSEEVRRDQVVDGLGPVL